MTNSKYDLKQVFTKNVLNFFWGQGYKLSVLNLSRAFERVAARGGRGGALVHKLFDGWHGPHHH